MAFKLDGFIKPVIWDKDNKKFTYKTYGDGDNKTTICGLNVAGKDKDGKTVYGQPIKIRLMTKSNEELSRVRTLIKDGKLVQFEGFFAPDNYTNKDGKEVQGNVFIVFDSTTFKEKQKEESKPKSKPEVKQEADDDVWG